MTNRRKHRWLRRLALGLAFATFAAPASARPDEGGGSILVQAAATAAEAIHDPYSTDVLLRQGDALVGPDGSALRPDDRAVRFTGIEQPQVISYLSHGMAADGEVGARPDDKADRFAHSDVVSSSELASSGSSVEWDGALTLGIGAVVLALALGLGFGFIRRPRLAGL